MTSTQQATRQEGGTAWVACHACRELIYGKRLAQALGVCPSCGVHHRLSAQERIGQLLDEGSVEELPSPDVVHDPLEFVDSDKYTARLASAEQRSGRDEAVKCVEGRIEGFPVVAAVMDFSFMGGSLGVAVGERITAAAEHALAHRIPFLVVTAAGGARMQEGALALMQMVKTSQAIGMLQRAGVPTISIVTDPTYGGVAASYATLPDVIMAEPGARIGFAGPRVIEQTIHQKLPDGFQTAEFTHVHGLIDAVVPRAALRHTLARLLAVLRTAQPGDYDGQPVLVRDAGALERKDAWERVQLARTSGRPTALDYFSMAFDEFHELQGDRMSGDCKAIVGGLGRIDGRPVVALGHQKGHDTRERMARNFGMPTPQGYRKAARLMRMAANLRLPIVTLVDTPGAYPGAEAEEGGQAWAIAENLRLMASLPVPIVSVVTGEGGSGGALALAVADRVLGLEHAIYSVISPEGCAAILWKDQRAAPLAAEALQLSAGDLLRHGIIDAVVPEPIGGAHTDPVMAGSLLRQAVVEALHDLDDTDGEGLVRQRQDRFRRFGVPEQGPQETRRNG